MGMGLGGNTPFRLWKRYTWLGGTRVPFIAHWPRGISEGGGVRGQFAHAIDVLPTVLDACGLTAPDSVDGIPNSPFRAPVSCLRSPILLHPTRVRCSTSR